MHMRALNVSAYDADVAAVCFDYSRLGKEAIKAAPHLGSVIDSCYSTQCKL